MREEKDLQKIIAFIETEFGIRYEEIISKTRKPEIVFMRSVLNYLFYYSSLLTSVEIGVMIGRDHTTVLHNLRKIESLIRFKEKRISEILLKWNSFK